METNERLVKEEVTSPSFGIAEKVNTQNKKDKADKKTYPKEHLFLAILL